MPLDIMGKFDLNLYHDVIWLPASDVYVIQDESKEILIPVIPEVINRVDFQNKEIIITPMDGLID